MSDGGSKETNETLNRDAFQRNYEQHEEAVLTPQQLVFFWLC